MYLIKGLIPRTDISIGRYCLHIDLHPSLTEIVKKSDYSQEKADYYLKTNGERLLKIAGFTITSLDVHRLRVSYGEWGLEHISVPGNACGLDIDQAMGCYFREGRTLVPHNLDSKMQQDLLVMIFCEITADVVLFAGY
jgi:hypothetical protein